MGTSERHVSTDQNMEPNPIFRKLTLLPTCFLCFLAECSGSEIQVA